MKLFLIALSLSGFILLGCNTIKAQTNPEWYETEINQEEDKILTLKSLKDYLDYRKQKNRWFLNYPPSIEDYYRFLDQEYDKQLLPKKGMHYPPLHIDDPVIHDYPPYGEERYILNGCPNEFCDCQTFSVTALYCDPPTNDCNTCKCGCCGAEWKCR